MQCADIKNLADDYIDGRLPQLRRRDVHEHLSHCRDCASEVTLKQQLLRRLRDLPAPQVQPHLMRRIEMSRRHTRRQQWRWFGAGIGAAMAAGLAVMALIALLKPLNETISAEPMVVAKVNQAGSVHILVHSGHTIDEVRFTLVVPENIELQGYEGRRQVAWKGRLRKGENLLSLPVVAVKPSSGTLVVIIEHGESSKEYHVNILSNTG